MPRLSWRKKKIQVVSNENAGKDMGKKRERDIIISMFEEAFQRDPHSKANLSVFKTHSLGDLESAKDEMRDDVPDLCIFFGGDGTIQNALGEDDGFLDEISDVNDPENGPMFAFFGTGSTNTIQGELSAYDRDPIEAARRIIEKIQADVPLDRIFRPYLKINGRKGFIYGSGLAGTLLEKYNAKSPKGKRRIAKIAAWMLFNEIFRFLPPWRRSSVAKKVGVSHEIWSEDGLIRRSEDEFSAIVASTLKQVGMGCRLTYRARQKVDHFHCVMSGMGYWGTVMNFPSMFRGVSMSGNVVDEIANKVILKYDGPVIHTIDGELFGHEEMTDTVIIEKGPTLMICHE